jgi:hypothetical protein
VPTYSSVYRAKSVKYEPPVLTAYVPQVFGDVPIEITDVIGSATQGMGWVFFQGGNPEFPVWSGGVSGNGGGGGTVTDTLWTGPSAPTDTSIELWWDTDEEAPLDPRYLTQAAGDTRYLVDTASFTPTITSGGFTLGTGGTTTGYYWRLGKGDSLDLIYYFGTITFGTSPTNGTSLFVSMPVAAFGDVGGRPGTCDISDSSPSTYYEGACIPGGTSLWLLRKVVSGTNIVHNNIAAGGPITFAVNDVITWTVWYPAA